MKDERDDRIRHASSRRGLAPLALETLARLGSLVNVTSRRQAERARLEAEQRFHRALEEQRRAHLEQIQQQNLELALRRNEVVRANRLKSEVLATVSHEFRTPLNAIIGFSELLAVNSEEPLSEKQSFHLSFVRQASDHLLRLINDILDLSKIEAGRLKLAPTYLLISTLLPEVLATIRPLAAKKELTFDQNVPDDLGVHADRLHLKQIFFNLLSNAVKFTPLGGIVTVHGESTSGFSLLAISNTGSTIDPADRETIFDEFQQAGQAMEGTGLGLAIVRRLVELNGGRIWVEISPDATAFVVLLPERQGSLARGPDASDSLPRAQRAAGSPPILVVSNDAAARERWAEELRRKSFRVATAACEEGALPRILNEPPQLILLDVASVGSPGCRLLRELLQANRETNRPLVVALAPDLAAQRSAFLAGADGCLMLPVDDAVLVKACRRRIEPLEAPRVVLIVDSDPERQRLLSEAVMTIGWRPVVASSQQEALQTASRILPHALLLRLPDLDAYQTVVQLRSNPATAEVPVVVLARKSAEALETQLLTGPSRFLWLAEEEDQESLKIEIQRLLTRETP